MRKKILYFLTIAIILLFASCSNEVPIDVIDKEIVPETGRKITLTASMPDDDPTSRVSLTQELNTKDINVQWAVGDVIELAIKQDANIKKLGSYILVAEDISNFNKRARFNIIIPTGTITETEDFTLYGVYGGRGISIANSTINALLPSTPGAATSLHTGATSVQGQKDVMLYFSKEMQASTQNVSVTFIHLGSLFSITVKNSSSSDNLTEIAKAQLLGVTSGNVNWAYNSLYTSQSYDLVNNTFQNITSANTNNYLSFKAERESLAKNGASITFWGWYPLLPDQKWPELKLVLMKSNGDVIKTSSNSQSAKKNAPIAGKSYYFYAEISGGFLKFPSDNSIVPTPADDLFFSEYIETGTAKYLEIFNGTGKTVDLSNYIVNLYRDGSSSPEATTSPLQLSGTLENGKVIIIKNSGAAAILPLTVLNIDSDLASFNGNDAIALRRKPIINDVYVDVIGKIGENPGNKKGWGTGNFSTMGRTLVRLRSIHSGFTTNPSSGIPTSAQWSSYDGAIPIGTVRFYLGWHAYTYVAP